MDPPQTSNQISGHNFNGRWNSRRVLIEWPLRSPDMTLDMEICSCETIQTNEFMSTSQEIFRI